MKFDPHIIKYILITGALLLRIFGRSQRKKSRPTPTQKQPPQPTAAQPKPAQSPAQSSVSRSKSKDDSPWSSGGNPFDS